MIRSTYHSIGLFSRSLFQIHHRLDNHLEIQIDFSVVIRVLWYILNCINVIYLSIPINLDLILLKGFYPDHFDTVHETVK